MPAATYFIALQPDANLTNRLQATKSSIYEIAGPQLYLDHPPHLTLYVGAFDGVQRLEAALGRLAASTTAPELNLVGWHAFMNDVLTGQHTLVCELAAHTGPVLRQIQHLVVSVSAPLRDVAATAARFTGKQEQLSAERRAAIEMVGFPFLGDDWQPHLTVASIRPADWERAWKAVAEHPIRGLFMCPELKLYRLDDGHPVEMSAWPLHLT